MRCSFRYSAALMCILCRKSQAYIIAVLNSLSIRIRFSLSLIIKFLISISLPIYITWYLSSPLAALAHHHLSPSLDLRLTQPWKSQIAHFVNHLISGINSLAHFVNHVVIFLFLICCSLRIISAHLRRHHCRHPSHLLFFVPTSKHPFYINLFLHRPPTPTGLLWRITGLLSGISAHRPPPLVCFL